MTNQEAIQVFKNISGLVSATKKDHMVIEEAIHTLESFVSKKVGKET